MPLIERLIAKGADVTVANEFGSTPMAEAATVGNAAVLAKLLDAGADVESPGADGQTALMIVARSSNVAAAKVLLDRGANVNASELWRAADGADVGRRAGAARDGEALDRARGARSTRAPSRTSGRDR